MATLTTRGAAPTASTCAPLQPARPDQRQTRMPSPISASAATATPSQVVGISPSTANATIATPATTSGRGGVPGWSRWRPGQPEGHHHQGDDDHRGADELPRRGDEGLRTRLVIEHEARPPRGRAGTSPTRPGRPSHGCDRAARHQRLDDRNRRGEALDHVPAEEPEQHVRAEAEPG